jgi:hypothetical protein
MPGIAPRSAMTRYAVTWIYLIGVIAAELSYVLLPARDQTALLAWVSTSVHNLTHHPVACLVASAFYPTGFRPAWPVLIALAMFGANHQLGNWRTAVTVIAGHVIGTLVSEGIVAYRVDHGTLPPADRFLIDVGPSYVVVAAIAVGLLYGGWFARAAAALDLALLVFIGGVFSGLTHLDLAPVGHLTALFTGAVVGSLLRWQQRRSRSAPAPAG